MNSFSDKEYQILKSDTAEIRSCITRYIGYIISVTGFSGVLRFFFEFSPSAMGSLILLSFSIIVVTFLFEIIWYKFKSHNRYVGYIQLMMQEVDAIPLAVYREEKDAKGNTIRKKEAVLSLEQLDDKDYISNYQDYLDRKLPKGINDLFSWEFMMSRLHGIHFTKKNMTHAEASLNSAVEKSRFVFSVPKHLQKYINIGNHDLTFFDRVVIPMYLNKNSKHFLLYFFHYLGYLFSDNSKRLLDHLHIDKSYVVNGWRYPKKITQIAFTSVIAIYLLFVYYLSQGYDRIDWDEIVNQSVKLGPEQLIPFVLLLINTGCILFWLLRYIRGLKEIVYGKNSIDFYCWMFFVFRNQMLNNKDVIPVIFSRAFVRYFKANMYSNVYESNSEIISGCLGPWGISTHDLTKYNKDLLRLVKFEGNQTEIHKVVVTAFKTSQDENHDNTLDVYAIDDSVLEASANSVFIAKIYS